MTKDLGASSGPGSREPSREGVSAASGFDPSREQWRAVREYRGLYEASDLGRIRSFYSVPMLVLTTRIDRWGYAEVKLSLGGKSKRHRVHRLVYEAFHAKTELEVIHLDGNRLNNCAGNLAEADREGVVLHAIRHGTHQVPSTLGMKLPRHRDSDRNPEGEKPQALSAKHESAGPKGIAQPPTSATGEREGE